MLVTTVAYFAPIRWIASVVSRIVISCQAILTAVSSVEVLHARHSESNVHTNFVIVSPNSLLR